METDADRIAAEVMRERLELSLTEYDAGERLRDVRVLGSPVQTVRMAFDLMARDTADDWQVLAERMALVPQGLSSIQAALAEGVAQGVVAARRQAIACTKQADTWGGVDPSTRPFFHTLVDEYDASGLARRPRSVPGSRRLADARHRGVRVAGSLPRRGVRAARRRARPRGP